MKKAVVVALIAMVAFVGCKKSEEGNGIPAHSNNIKVVVLAKSVDIKQGEVQIVYVSVERGAAFQQTVKLEVRAPMGLQVHLGSTTVQAGDKGDVQLKITAAKDAPLGKNTILVKGTPEHGEPSETALKVTVSAK